MKNTMVPGIGMWSVFQLDKGIDFTGFFWKREQGNVLIDPLPTMTARPATVGACQVREQLSMLLVPIATRANFCIR